MPRKPAKLKVATSSQKRTRAPKAVSAANVPSLYLSYGGSAWSSSLFPSTFIHEPFSGAWQQNAIGDFQPSPLAFSAVHACVTGISSDIGKLRPKLMMDESGIWEEILVSPFLPVLTEPNGYQNRIQFLTCWMLSKLLNGNAYIALERDNRGGPNNGVVRAMHVLDPCRVRPLITPTGVVFYQLSPDRLPNIQTDIIVEASEIIHDRMDPLWHPLIGVSPLFACAAAGRLGSSIQANASKFFANQSQPGGMLTAPGRISDETAARMKVKFEENFTGVNIGRIFVGGDGLKFEPLGMTAEASQLVEQLRLSREDVCTAFHYPIFKIDSTKLPPYSGNNMESLGLLYLTDCLQRHIEDIELLLEYGLSLPSGQHIELDTLTLRRMDTASLYEANNKGVGGGWLSPNEARFRANLKPVAGGDTPYMQQQNFSLKALSEQSAAPMPTAAPVPQRAEDLEESLYIEMREALA